MSKELSELTLILHRIDIDGYFVYQRKDNHEKINPKNIEFLKEYPNPILVSQKRSEFVLELINPDYIPQRANALVVGYGKEEGENIYLSCCLLSCKRFE